MSSRSTRASALLGIDVGTTSVKAGVFDLSGRVLGTATTPYETYRPAPGWVEQDPMAWWRSMEVVVDQSMAQGRSPDVGAIGICSQVNTHVFVDHRATALLPAVVWQDQRAGLIATELDSTIGEAQRDGLWGAPVHIDASSALARISWCERHRPEVFRACRWVLSPKDFCNARLTGEVASDAMSAIGLVDAGGGYLRRVLDLVPRGPELCPPLRPMTAVLGESISALGPVPPGIPVVTGSMDAWGSRYGSGVVELAQGMDVSGTSEILGLLSDRSAPSPGVVTFPPLSNRWFHAGPTQAAGDALRWWSTQARTDVATLLADAGRVPAGAGGLLFLPHLMGERAPLWDTMARGAMVGLSTDHGPGHLARAVLEGVAFSARHLLEALEGAAARPCEVLRASGGGSASDLWCQIKADVLGRPLERLALPATGVLGAAIMAGVGAGLLHDLDTAGRVLPTVERCFDPDMAAHRRYQDLYDAYRQLQQNLVPSHLALSRFRSDDAPRGASHP